jgi:putative DNA primase/helicase
MNQNSSSGTTEQKQFAYCYFKNEKDNEPKQRSDTWEGIVRKLGAFEVKPHKSGTLWSSVIYQPGSKRGNKGVQYVTMAVLDIDEVQSLYQLQQQLDGWAYLLHTTYSHTKEAPKYRVVLPLETPVPAKAWSEIWERLRIFSLDLLDPCTKDLGRAYYAPIRPSGAEEYFSEVYPGRWLSVEELPYPLRSGLTSTQAKTFERSPANLPTKSTAAIDFAGLNEQALQAFDRFIDWLCLEGEQRGKQFVALNPKRSDKSLGSFCINTETGIWKDFAIDTGGGDLVSLVAYIKDLTQGAAFRSLSGLLSNPVVKPEPVPSMCPVEQSESKKKKPLRELVDEFLERHYPKGGLIYLDGSFRGYQEGHWKTVDEQFDLRHQIAIHLGSRANPQSISSHISLLRDLRSRRVDRVASQQMLCLKNGTLDLATGRFLDHDPEHWMLNQLPFNWEPDAVCPNWTKFLEDVFADDPDKAEKISFLQEWTGYCLVPDTSQEKFVWICGPGGNGKSVYLSTLRELVGPANVSTAQIERLEDKYVRAELLGKLVNISPEMGAEATVADSFLKAVVSGDAIEAERKFERPFSFKPFCRIVGSTNHLPRLLDHSEGFARRAVILTFNRTFSEREQNKGLRHQLEAELPGILPWAVEGLKRQRSRGLFAIPPSASAALARYREESDPVRLFANERLAQDLNGRGLKPAEVYSEYRYWCGRNGHHPSSNVVLGKRLSGLGFTKRKSGIEYWRVRLVDEQLNRGPSVSALQEQYEV